MPFDIHQHGRFEWEAAVHDTFEPKKHTDQELLALNIGTSYLDGCEDYLAEVHKCKMTLFQ